MIETMRWFGPKDTVPLEYLRQAGCSGIVTALHQIPVGEVWPTDEIQKRQSLIAEKGMRWEVVESLPVHEDIKKGLPGKARLIANYQESLRNLASCGIRTVCYNFMPVLDWSRTQLDYLLPSGARTLRFVWEDFAVFDLFILRRPGAEADYSETVREAARTKFGQMTELEKTKLQDTILLGLPGSEEAFDLDTFQCLLDEYAQIGEAGLRENLYDFLRQAGPEAEACGANLCIHPDDPPRPLLGLPRVVSTGSDLEQLLEASPVRANGLTFCTGSLGAHANNDLPALAERFADRIHFVHLRATRREENPMNFHEAEHLDGNVDMYAIVRAILLEEQRRAALGMPDAQLPFRPDHGHQMLDDLEKKTYPGYSAIGRLKGLAEIRGLAYGIQRAMKGG
ncbi:MAG: mannonate dehydratase [Haliscomenobacter sp.]|nr:mannonate dehydratase [Haliscomenobacter sp.]